MVDDGPPKDTDMNNQRDSETPSYMSQRYADTPMPTDFEDEDEHPTKSSIFSSQAFHVLVFALIVAHLWTIWTLRTDMNIVMQYQQDAAAQNKHIASLLHTQHQVKWQIVPSAP